MFARRQCFQKCIHELPRGDVTYSCQPDHAVYSLRRKCVSCTLLTHDATHAHARVSALLPKDWLAPLDLVLSSGEVRVFEYLAERAASYYSHMVTQLSLTQLQNLTVPEHEF